jgi:hypothetical protein
MSASRAVAKVTQSLLDDERTLIQESRRVGDPLRAVLTRLAGERRSFAEELERFNGQGSRESWGALARELRRNLWTRMAGRDARQSVAACQRSQQRTEAQYRNALHLDLPGDLKAALVAQQERLREARAELGSLG